MKTLGNISNGNIIITEELADALIKADKVNDILESLRKSGLKIMVAAQESAPRLSRQQIGLFDGTFNAQTGRIKISSPGEGAAVFDAEMLKDGRQMEESLKELGRLNKNIVIFDTAIEAYVGSDRAGLGKFFEEITSVKILKYFANAEITAESARETGRNFDIESIMFDFPNMTEKDIEAAFEFLKDENAEPEDFFSGNLNMQSGARNYLARIGARVKDEASAREIKMAYLEGLAEKFAAAFEFKKAGRTYGFRNKNTERLAGQLAAFKYRALPADVPQEDIDAVIDEIKGMRLSKDYNNKIAVIINERPRAIPAAADLMLDMIFAYEDEIKMSKSDFKRAPDIQLTEAVLQSA
jgi:hypothetical protein